MTLDSRLLDLLRCPECRSPLAPDVGGAAGAGGAGGADSEISCTGCGLLYPVRNDVPVLLVDEARRPGS